MRSAYRVDFHISVHRAEDEYQPGLVSSTRKLVIEAVDADAAMTKAVNIVNSGPHWKLEEWQNEQLRACLDASTDA